jgi:hypothetical protein
LQQNYSARGLGWNQLDGVAENGAQVKAALERQGFSVRVVQDATGAQLREAISSFLHEPRDQAPADPNSLTRALIYFAGHGANSTDSGRLMGYLVPVDAPSPDRTTAQPAGARFVDLALPVDWLRDQAMQSTARHTLIVLDSCFSSSILGSRSTIRPPSFSTMDEFRRRAVYVLTASDVETPDRGPFTPAFVEAISGAADLSIGGPPDGLVTASEVGIYVKNRVLDSPRAHGTPSFAPIFAPNDPSVGEMMFGPPAVGRVAASTSASTQATIQMAQLFSRPLRAGEHPILDPCTGMPPNARQTPEGQVPITVCYFRKDGDATRVSDALSHAHIPFDAPPAILHVLNPDGSALSTNRIGCGADAPIEAVRQTALTLFDAGVSLRAIGPIAKYAERRRNQIQVLTDLDYASFRPLTRDQIAAMSSCTSMLHN